MQLQPLVKKQPLYLKDDNDFLHKIDDLNKTQTVPPNATLVTCDVKSLYTNIPHEEGLDALQKTLENEMYQKKDWHNTRFLQISTHMQPF